METEILLETECDTEQDADTAIANVMGNYDSMTAENGQTIVDVNGNSGLLIVAKTFLAEVGLWVVRMILVLLGVPYPLLP